MAIDKTGMSGPTNMTDYINELTDFEPRYSVHDQINMASRFYRYIPTVKTIVDTLASLILTDIDISAGDGDSRARKMLEGDIEISTFLRRVVIEYLVTGNVFIVAQLPADKKFKCPKCGKEILLSSYNDSDKYKISGDSIALKCTSCKAQTAIRYDKIEEVQASDTYRFPGSFVPDIKLFEPNKVEIVTAPGSNGKMIVYSLSDSEKSSIKSGKYMFVLKSSPLAFIKSTFEKDNAVLLSKSVIHVHDTEVTGQMDGWGIVPLMAAYKMVYYLSALRRQSIESAALRSAPIYLLSPTDGGGVDLSEVKDGIEKAVEDSQRKSKRYAVAFSPAAVNVQPLFADFKATSLTGEIKLAQNELAVAIGLPADLVYGGSAQWSAASANIRMMEKRFVFLYEALERVCDKIADVVNGICGSNISVSPTRLRVMDDMAVTQSIINLMASNRVSYDTVMQRLGLDPEDEIKKIRGAAPGLTDIDIEIQKKIAEFQREFSQESQEDTMAFQRSLQDAFPVITGGQVQQQQEEVRPDPQALPPRR